MQPCVRGAACSAAWAKPLALVALINQLKVATISGVSNRLISSLEIAVRLRPKRFLTGETTLESTGRAFKPTLSAL